MYQQSLRDDPRSTMSIIERHEDGQRPALHRGRSNTFTAYRPYEDSLYYNEPATKQSHHQIVPQRRRHSMQRRTSYWDRFDSDSSESSDDEYYRSRRSHSRPRGRALSRRPRARERSISSGSSHSCSRSHLRSRSHRRRPIHASTRPKETYTLTKALKAAAMAATVEAVRCRAEPGSWRGQKSQRVAVAACSGAAVGSLRNGRLQKSGKLPYAEAAMTGAYSVDFLKRVLRQTEFAKDAEEERREWEVEERGRDGRSRSRRR